MVGFTWQNKILKLKVQCCIFNLFGITLRREKNLNIWTKSRRYFSISVLATSVDAQI